MGLENRQHPESRGKVRGYITSHWPSQESRRAVGRFLGAGAVTTAAYFADTKGINWALHEGISPQSGALSVRNMNNFWDTVMLTTPIVYGIYESAKNKAKKVTRRVALALSGAAMLPGILCNVASEVPAINNTYVMQEVLPPVFRSPAGTINPYHAIDGGLATAGEGAVLFIALRRRKDESNSAPPASSEDQVA